jgi:hypothetical protein
MTVGDWTMWKMGVALLAVMAGSGAASDAIDADAARAVFAEFRSLCTPENTALWGKELCGPMMLVGPDGEVVTNRPAAGLDPDGDGVFRGRLPEGTPVANTAIEWQGVRWTQLVWPIQAGNEDRRVLLAHEAFHRIQPEIGIVVSGADNSHLDSKDGRLWLRLEAAALAKALDDTEDWRTVARDALLFRATRLAAFPEAGANECTLLINEGLAEYTGVKAGGGTDTRRLAVERLRSVNKRPSLVRTMGYIVGPAYGLLLDRTGEDWRAAVRAGGCPSVLLEAAIGRSTGAARQRAAPYGYAAIAAEEERRETAHREALARYRTMFVEGPVLLVRFEDMHISFNPNRMTALPPLGTVYTTGRVQDAWGHVDVDGDFLLSSDWKSMRLPGPIVAEGNTVSGTGWELTFAPGWAVRPGERGGDFVLVRTGDLGMPPTAGTSRPSR